MRSSRADYYLATLPGARQGAGGLVEAEAYWLGAASRDLGLRGKVQPADLRAVLAGRHPRSGRDLIGPRSSAQRTLVGFDCTFSTPKSVSLLFALGPEEIVPSVRAAHDEALASALSYLERQAARVTFRGGGRRWGADAGGIVAAVFPHRTSRAPDPHLHSHVLVANLVPLASGEWHVLDARPWYAELRTAGALYETELRANLGRSLGVRFRELNGRAWSDVAGVETGWLEEFSRRRSAISTALAESGLDVRATNLVAEVIRPPKDFDTSFEQQLERWRERGYRVGLAPAFLARAVDRPDLEQGCDVTEAWARDALRIALSRSPDRSFSRSDLIRARCETAPQGLPVAGVEKDVDDLLSGRVRGVETVERGTAMVWAWHMPVGQVAARYSTRETVGREQQLVRLVEADPTAFAIVAHDETRRLAALESITRSMGEAGVIALAPGVRAARAFESLTGMTSVPSLAALAATAGPEGEPRRVVLVDPHRLRAGELESAIEGRTAANRPDRPAETVMLVPQGACQRDPLLAQLAGVVLTIPISSTVGVRGRVQRLEVGDTRVVLADGPRAVLEAALAEARNEPTILVTGERAVARQLRAVDSSARVLDPRQLATKLPNRDEKIVVIGGATELGLPQKVLDKLPRTHVLAAPADLPGEADRARALVGELVRPAHLCRAMGVPPHAPQARALWREGAAIVERNVDLHAGPNARPWGLRPAERQQIVELRRACRALSLNERARDLARVSSERNAPGLER